MRRPQEVAIVIRRALIEEILVAINMSNQRHWHAPVQLYVGDLLDGEGIGYDQTHDLVSPSPRSSLSDGETGRLWVEGDTAARVALIFAALMAPVLQHFRPGAAVPMTIDVPAPMPARDNPWAVYDVFANGKPAERARARDPRARAARDAARAELVWHAAACAP